MKTREIALQDRVAPVNPPYRYGAVCEVLSQRLSGNLREAVPKWEGTVGMDGEVKVESRFPLRQAQGRPFDVAQGRLSTPLGMTGFGVWGGERWSTDALPQRLKPNILRQVHAGLKACSTQKRLRRCQLSTASCLGRPLATAPLKPREGLNGARSREF